MDSYKVSYRSWLGEEALDEETRKELRSLSEDELADRFSCDLEFGTGGLRGEMGAGTHRINRYTIRKATQGLADYLLTTYGDAKERGVVIVYDSRNHSAEYALETALVLCANGIHAYVFRALMPTPVLSFSVRHLHTVAGVVITASHNTKEYNGYKVYDDIGCQAVPRVAGQIIEFIERVSDVFSISVMSESDAVSAGLLKYLGDEVLEAFIGAVGTQAHPITDGAKDNLRIVYTPLHGTGNVPVRRVLAQQGFTGVSVVGAQEMPDGNFPTVRSPNPEDKAALQLAIDQAREEKVDIVIGTDPDCDRVGVAVYDGQDYSLLTGNQIGALLVDYLCRRRSDRLTSDTTVVKTIVTSELGAVIAKSHGLRVIDTLTGFKYIGEQANRLGENFLAGYEESYGYLVGLHALDKDAVVSSMLICEMAAFWKTKGKTLIDVIREIYDQYGYYADALDTFTLKGVDGQQKIARIMARLRTDDISFDGAEAKRIDYLMQVDELPKADVVKFVLADGSWIAVRPSGTEPKLKVYYSVKGSDESAAKERLSRIQNRIVEIVEADK